MLKQACGLTVRQVVTEVNRLLKEAYNTPMVDGVGIQHKRTLVDMHEVQYMLTKICGDYNFTSDRFDIVLPGTALQLKARRKKSGVKRGWDRKEQMTVVAIEPINPAILDKIVQQLYLEAQQRDQSKKDIENQKAAKRKHDFEVELSKYNMPLEKFVELHRAAMGYDCRTRKLLGIEK